MIRKAKVGDGQNIKNLHTAAVVELCSSHYDSSQIEALTHGTYEAFEKTISTSPLCLVYEVDGTIQGFVSLKRNMSIWHLYVSPRHGGKGIGRQLLSAAEAHISERGIPTSDVLSTLNACSFYETCGYKKLEDLTIKLLDVDFKVVHLQKNLSR